MEYNEQYAYDEKKYEELYRDAQYQIMTAGTIDRLIEILEKLEEYRAETLQEFKTYADIFKRYCVPMYEQTLNHYSGSHDRYAINSMKTFGDTVQEELTDAGKEAHMWEDLYNALKPILKDKLEYLQARIKMDAILKTKARYETEQGKNHED